ncbi:MAG: hypothetical protein QM802_04780 [Agriterribacter sp.]
MQITSFQTGERSYQLSYETITREKDLFIYWGSIHLKQAIEFSCMKIDDQPIFITNPVTLPETVQSSVLKAITDCETRLHSTNCLQHL